MIDTVLLFLLLQGSPESPERVLRQIEESGRLVVLTESASERVAERPQIAPGAPPLLSFRYFEGRDRHRFGELDLVLDDAGH
ncbi:MAG: hypothetical protein ACK5AZ_14880 [Bryobacteraceae bacterium]